MTGRGQRDSVQDGIMLLQRCILWSVYALYTSTIQHMYRGFICCWEAGSIWTLKKSQFAHVGIKDSQSDSRECSPDAARRSKLLKCDCGSEVAISSLLDSSPSLFHLIFIQPLRSRSIATREQETSTRTQTADRSDKTAHQVRNFTKSHLQKSQ